jgi:hypothetical protein
MSDDERALLLALAQAMIRQLVVQPTQERVERAREIHRLATRILIEGKPPE